MKIYKHFILCFVAFLSFTNSLCGYMYDLSILAIFQDEARFLKEWIEFHKIVGVQHFYLINHCSTDNYEEVLAPYIENGEVTLFHATEEHPKSWNDYQAQQYTLLLPVLLDSKWVAVLDCDEFLFPVKEFSLRQFLSNYDDPEIASLYVFWQCYGTSFVPEIYPDELMIEKLILRAKEQYIHNKYGKSIIRPDRTFHISLHVSLPLYGHCMTSNKKIYDLSNLTFESVVSRTVKVSDIRINHYWTKDEKFFNEVKKPRYRKWDAESECTKRYLDLNRIRDRSIYKYLPQLKAAMRS